MEQFQKLNTVFLQKLLESFQETKQHVVDYLKQFQNDYQNELFPLIFVVEFLTSQLFVQFDSEIMEIFVNYITIKNQQNLVFPIPSVHEQQLLPDICDQIFPLMIKKKNQKVDLIQKKKRKNKTS